MTKLPRHRGKGDPIMSVFLTRPGAPLWLPWPHLYTLTNARAWPFAQPPRVYTYIWVYIDDGWNRDQHTHTHCFSHGRLCWLGGELEVIGNIDLVIKYCEVNVMRHTHYTSLLTVWCLIWNVLALFLLFSNRCISSINLLCFQLMWINWQCYRGTKM